MTKLSRQFYLQPTLEVARELIGKVLVFHSPLGKVSGIINETEAYIGAIDPAAHSHRGITPRTQIMFGEGGFSYVYFIYGMYFCLNVVTEEKGIGAAVLIRSVIPLEGETILHVNTGKENAPLHTLTNGPGKLAKAFGITKEQNGINLVNSDFMWIEDQGFVAENIEVGPRIGISKAQDLPWRFWTSPNSFTDK